VWVAKKSSRFGSNNRIWLKMFPITCDAWTHSDESSCPELEGLGTTNAPSLAHQITDSSSHSFYRPCSGWQIELWMVAVRSELIDPSEELSDDHAHDTQFCCLTTEMPQLHEYGFQTGPVGELESLAGELVERFAQGSASQAAIASASAVLQSTDEVEMAELNDPALAFAEPDDSRNLVGDRGPDASVYVSGDRRDCLRPAPQVLPARQEQRIEEDGLISMARLDRHQIQHPISSSKSEVKSVQEQNQRAWRQAQPPRSQRQLSQRLAKTAAEPLSRKGVPWSKSFQCAPLQQNRLHNSTRHSPRLATAAFLADSPGVSATAALTTSRSEAINFRSATRRFRVQRIHARELSTD
jgi:hypothetical protein